MGEGGDGEGEAGEGPGLWSVAVGGTREGSSRGRRIGEGRQASGQAREKGEKMGELTSSHLSSLPFTFLLSQESSTNEPYTSPP